MSNYMLSITRREPNPEFKEKRSPYDPEQYKYLSENALSVEITEEQFSAIRKAVLEKF